MDALVEIEKYWDKKPCNSGHSNANRKSKKYFLEVTKKRYFVEPHILNFINSAKYKDKNVLELGCGIGTDAAIFSSNGANYFGIELSEKSLDFAKQRFKLFALKGQFEKVSIEDLNLKKLNWPSPNLIYSFGVIHHTINPLSALKNIVKQVERGTVFKIMLYAKNSYKFAMISKGLDQYESQKGCPVAHVYSYEDVQTLFKKAGLKIVDLRQDHIFPYKIKEYKNNKYIKEKWFDVMPKAQFEALKTNFGWHLLISAIK